MTDLTLFGTDSWPLHPSALRSLLVCPWSAVLPMLYDLRDEGGQAAATGTATHAAVHAFHGGKGVAASIEVMQGGASRYPIADLADAATLFCRYAADPANACTVIVSEQAVAFSIEADPQDPTGSPIEVRGTLDQVREVGGRLELWDLKTSKKQGHVLLANHVFQIAAYCVGATVLLGRTVHPGGLILPRMYPRNAHWKFAWTFADVEQILSPVRRQVAAIRGGDVHHVPGDWCQWCPAKSPDACLPKLQRTLEVIRRG